MGTLEKGYLDLSKQKDVQNGRYYTLNALFYKVFLVYRRVFQLVKRLHF